jgi:hypothetical protein
MIRLLFFLVVAALETTAVSLPFTALTTANLPWMLIFATVACGWLADQISVRLPERYDRPALAVGGLVASSLFVGGALGVNPLVALLALFPGGADGFLAYIYLILALFLFWRGTRLDTRDSGAISNFFSRSAAIAVACLLLGALFGTGAPLGSMPVLAHVVGFISLGLLALALVHAQEVSGGSLRGLSWRWLLTLVGAVALVVVIATVATGVLGGSEAMAAAQGLLRIIMLPIAFVGAVLAWLVITFIAEPLALAIQAILARLQELGMPVQPETPPQEPRGAAEAIERIEAMANGATFLLALIPIVIMAIAILLMRQRVRNRPKDDEERESLGLLNNLGDDLRELLQKLRNPFARPLEGLQAALASLVGEDASTRARRAYVRLLLLLEGREQRRPSTQTPAEFAPAAAAAASAPEAVERLTAAYERARYNPGGASAADAADAEAALRGISER